MHLDKITQAPPMPPAIRRMLDHLAKVVGALNFTCSFQFDFFTLLFNDFYFLLSLFHVNQVNGHAKLY